MHPSQWDRIVLTDIDNFKYYNDTYGHGRGDQILLMFVAIIQENLRINDLLMRLGGDEFLIFLSNVDTMQADKILKRIGQQFKDRIDDEYIGFSYGIEIIGKDIEEAVANADILMYEMKKCRKLNHQQPVL
jgi:diguanylate cyclase (GGDEF)-like protein